MAWWVSWALSVLGACGIFLTGRKKWYGFAVGILNECAWVAYSINTKQWGFIFGSAIYIVAYSHGIQNWLTEARKTKIRSMFKINPLNMVKKNK